jgi:hypothetical protein
MERGYNAIASIMKYRQKYSFILDFDTIVSNLKDADQVHFISSALRNTKTQQWLRWHADVTMVRVFGQELVNGLAVLAESVLKKKQHVTKIEFGPILQQDMGQINSGVNCEINGPTNYLFRQYPIKSVADLNLYFTGYFAALDACGSEDEFKAKAIYIAYRLRNQVLHQFHGSLIYYQDQAHFEAVIGILFISLSAILSL